MLPLVGLALGGIYDDEGDPTVLSILQRYDTAVDSRLVSRSLRMSGKAADAWAGLVLSNANLTRYFEWGSGGSTEAVAWAAHAGRFEAYSVDSSEDWFAELRKDSGLIRAAESDGKLKLLTANVGATEEWGNPVGWETSSADEQRAKAQAYTEAPLMQVGGLFDVMLVDGRWRLACGLSALRVLKSSSSRLMVHDYFEEANPTQVSASHTVVSSYDQLLRWYDLIQSANELAIFAPKLEALEAARAGGARASEFASALEHAYHIKGMAADARAALRKASSGAAQAVALDAPSG